MLYLINHANKPCFYDELASMHRLRKSIFVDTLGWQHPNIKVNSEIEYDQFDSSDSSYLVHVDKEGNVDACTRLIPTTQKYLLGDEYPELVQSIDVPRHFDIWESSRYCVSPHCANKKMMGVLAAGMLEFALAAGIKKYVSMSDIRIEVIIKRYGWSPERLGPILETDTESSAGESFDVSYDTYKTVCEKSHCTDGQVIYNLEEVLQISHAA